MRPGNPSRAKWLTTFVPHRLEMLISPSWSAVPSPLRRMLEQLEIEHLRHGGAENGNLFVAYSHFAKAGISKRQIRSLCELGEALGLMQVIKSDDFGNGRVRPPNAYRLTYVPAKGAKAPTDEWRSISTDRAADCIRQFRQSEQLSRRRDEDEPMSTSDEKVLA